MERLANEVLSVINQMEPRHWVLVLAGMVVVGLVFLKGMGARSN